MMAQNLKSIQFLDQEKLKIYRYNHRYNIRQKVSPPLTGNSPKQWDFEEIDLYGAFKG